MQQQMSGVLSIQRRGQRLRRRAIRVGSFTTSINVRGPLGRVAAACVVAGRTLACVVGGAGLVARIGGACRVK